MKRSLAISLTSMLFLLPLVSQSQGTSSTQPSQDQPVVINPAPVVEQIATSSSPQSPDQLRQSMQDHFRTCHQSLEQARDQAHKLSRGADQPQFDIDALDRQHQQLQEQIRTLKGNHDQFLADLSNEQQKAVQDHNQSLQQIHDRIQVHLRAIDQEFTGGSLHLQVVSDETKAAEREIKSYHKHLQETGKAFNLLGD